MIKNMFSRFTGERVVEGKTPDRIWVDHVERYKFACKYAKNKTILDIACGTGYGSKLVHDAGGEDVFGVDISRETIDSASARYDLEGLTFKVGSILNIEFPENFFDLIICFETIEHIKNPEAGLMELWRVLKPKGILIISSPNRVITSWGRTIDQPPCNAFHEFEFTTNEFRSFVASHFQLIELFGQRGIIRILFFPILKNLIHRFFLPLYGPERGKPKLERLFSIKEYRYITIVGMK